MFSKNVPHQIPHTMTMWQFIQELTTPYKLWILCFIMCMVLSGMHGIASSYIIKEVIDTLTYSNNIAPVYIYSIIFVVIYELHNLTWRGVGYINYTLQPIIKNNAIAKLFTMIHQNSYDFINNSLTSGIVSCVNTITDNIEKILHEISMHIIRGATLLTVSLITMYSIHYLFFIGLLIWVAFFITTSFIFAQRIKSLSDHYAYNKNLVNGTLGDSISNFHAVRVFANVAHEESILNKILMNLCQSSRSKDWFLLKIYLIQGASISALIGFMLYILLDLKIANAVTVGDFSLILSLTVYVANYSWRVTEQIDALNIAIGKCKQGLTALFPNPQYDIAHIAIDAANQQGSVDPGPANPQRSQESLNPQRSVDPGPANPHGSQESLNPQRSQESLNPQRSVDPGNTQGSIDPGPVNPQGYPGSVDLRSVNPPRSQESLNPQRSQGPVDLLDNIDINDINALSQLDLYQLYALRDKYNTKSSNKIERHQDDTQNIIIFDQVCFSHKNNNKLYMNHCIKIKRNTKIGLVGYSGSGKSTFINLILKLYHPNSGTIYIDGVDIMTITHHDLMQKIAVIPQDTVLFHRSIRDNIQYGNINKTFDDVISVAQTVDLHDYIRNLPHGYDTIVGERGVNLSGGQKQSLLIARAILKDAPILIFDEPTSQLDSISEMKIHKILHDISKDKTVIIIAHKLSTLFYMDRILVFDTGVIVQDGSHAKLMMQRGQLYDQLLNAQIDGMLPLIIPPV